MIFTFVLCGMLMHMAVEAYGNDPTMMESKMRFAKKAINVGMIVMIKKNCAFKFSGSVVTINFVLSAADYVDDINSNLDSYRIHFGIYPTPATVSIVEAFKHKDYLKLDPNDAIRRSFSPFNAGLLKVLDEEAFINVLSLNNCYDCPLYRIEKVIVEGLMEPQDYIEIGSIQARVLPKEECEDIYKNIEIDVSLTCLDMSDSNGKLDATDLGTPVFIPECPAAVGIVSYIPEGNLQGKPIIMTNLIRIISFIKEKTGFAMHMYQCNT